LEVLLVLEADLELLHHIDYSSGTQFSAKREGISMNISIVPDSRAEPKGVCGAHDLLERSEGSADFGCGFVD
jgi:hypothetical protein